MVSPTHVQMGSWFPSQLWSQEFYPRLGLALQNTLAPSPGPHGPQMLVGVTPSTESGIRVPRVQLAVTPKPEKETKMILGGQSKSQLKWNG